MQVEKIGGVVVEVGLGKNCPTCYPAVERIHLHLFGGHVFLLEKTRFLVYHNDRALGRVGNISCLILREKVGEINKLLLFDFLKERLLNRGGQEWILDRGPRHIHNRRHGDGRGRRRTCVVAVVVIGIMETMYDVAAVGKRSVVRWKLG